MKTLNIETRTHGRVLLQDVEAPAAMVVGFHGYFENGEIQMERLLSIPGAERWTLVSVQGLHRCYRGRSNDVVASWMTRQDRELMIDDNVEYTNQVLDRIASRDVPIVAVGFSQGAAMAFRAAARGRRAVAAVVAVGGDVPPELLADGTVTFPPALIVRGERDEWFTAEKADSDIRALRARNVAPDYVVHAGGHEWTPDVSAAIASFVSRIAS